MRGRCRVAHFVRLSKKLGLEIIDRRKKGSSEAAERLSRRVERQVTGAEVDAEGPGAIAASTTFCRLVKQSDECTIDCPGKEVKKRKPNSD